MTDTSTEARPAMTLKHSDIEALLHLFGESDWQEMHLTYHGEELYLSKDPNAPGLRAAPAPAGGQPAAAPAAPATQAAPAPSVGAPVEAPAERDRGNWVAVTAPNLGTFYRAPSPDAAAYVTEGAAVTPETEICLVEVMKLFTTIRAGLSGTVREIVAQDGAMVEYGETLMWIEPED